MVKKTKRGPGRPPLENAAHLRIAFRVTKEQRARYDAAAKAAGLTLTAWMEKHLERAAARA